MLKRFYGQPVILSVVKVSVRLTWKPEYAGPLAYFHYPIGPMLLRKTWVQTAPTLPHTYFSAFRLMVKVRAFYRFLSHLSVWSYLLLTDVSAPTHTAGLVVIFEVYPRGVLSKIFLEIFEGYLNRLKLDLSLSSIVMLLVASTEDNCTRCWLCDGIRVQNPMKMSDFRFLQTEPNRTDHRFRSLVFRNRFRRFGDGFHVVSILLFYKWYN